MSNPTLTYRRTTLDPVQVSALRHIGPYQQIGSTFSRLHPTPGTRRWFAVYYDNPQTCEPGDLRSHACCEILEGEDAVPGTIETTVGEGTYAVFRYVGPYTGISEAWSAFMKLLAQENVTFREEPCVEEYLDDPHKTPPNELRTDLYAPVQ